MLEEIKQKIKHGTFDFAQYFPDARRAAAFKARSVGTFGEVAEAWFAGLSDIEHSTRVGYRRILDAYWLSDIADAPPLKDRDIASIKNSDIRARIGSIPVGRKTRNNILIVARGVFNQAVADEVIVVSPMALIKNAKAQREPPDPFELEEVEIHLAQLDKMYGDQVSGYFEFAFFSGVRPSEEIALMWGDVDWRRSTVSVRRAKVWGEEKDRVKNFVARDIELTARALAALQRQKAHTFLAQGQIFHNPHTGRPWANVEHQRRLWGRAFPHTKLRYREPYQTRHTFASQAIMAGANPAWVARQLGHVNMGMLLKVYAKWIDAADRSRERAKLDAAFSTSAAPGAGKMGATS